MGRLLKTAQQEIPIKYRWWNRIGNSNSRILQILPVNFWFSNFNRKFRDIFANFRILNIRNISIKYRWWVPGMMGYEPILRHKRPPDKNCDEFPLRHWFSSQFLWGKDHITHIFEISYWFSPRLLSGKDHKTHFFRDLALKFLVLHTFLADNPVNVWCELE